MNVKKISKWSVFLILLLIASVFSGCAPSTQPTTIVTEAPGLYTPGTYTGEAQGYGGVLRVEVVLDKESIVSVEVIEHSESAGVSDEAINTIPEEIVANQTLAVDVVAGASFSSQAILEAVEKAMIQAGADIDLLK